MQSALTGKKKFVMEEYVSPNRANPMIKNFNQEICTLTCICQPKNEDGFSCFKCKTFVHCCLASKPNRGQLYECFTCVNRGLDPLFQVRKVLVDSYFKTFSIFEYINIFNFEFTLGQEDLGYPVEVRGLVPENTFLTWPMQGAYYINDQKTSFFELKPLLYNSNRKHRREEYFTVPSDKLKAGRNFIRFKIPCLDKAKFTSKYQHEDKKVYYMAVNSVERMTPADLQTQTFRERRIEKAESIKLLTSNNADIQVAANKVCLVCPYTRERIKVPVRGRYCQHFSCICLQTLIASHSSSRYWGCPICQLKINEPYVDVWIYNMLKDNQRGSEVTVKEDGTYEWIKVVQNMAMNLDSDDDSSPAPPPRTQPVKPSEVKIQPAVIKPLPPPPPPPQKPLKQVEIQPKKEVAKEMNVISLDDDQEDMTPRKQPEPKKEVLKKVKEKLKANQTQALKMEKPEESRPLKDPIFQHTESKRKEDQKPRLPFATDIRVLQVREMRFQQFKKSYFKTKVNPYRKYIQTQQLKRLFKEIF